MHGLAGFAGAIELPDVSTALAKAGRPFACMRKSLVPIEIEPDAVRRDDAPAEFKQPPTVPCGALLLHGQSVQPI